MVPYDPPVKEHEIGVRKAGMPGSLEREPRLEKMLRLIGKIADRPSRKRKVRGARGAGKTPQAPFEGLKNVPPG